MTLCLVNSFSVAAIMFRNVELFQTICYLVEQGECHSGGVWLWAVLQPQGFYYLRRYAGWFEMLCVMTTDLVFNVAATQSRNVEPFLDSVVSCRAR